MNKKGVNSPIIILSILLSIAVIIIIFMFYNSQSSNEKVEIIKTDSKKTQGDIEQSSVTDCGSSIYTLSAESIIENEENYNCFIDAARSCTKSKFSLTTNINWFGVEQTSTNYYEIKGMQSNSCLFYIKSESADLSYNDATVQSFLGNGMSQEEINQQEQELRNVLKTVEGKDGTCRYDSTNQLVELLNGWKQGDFSTEDFDNADCSGRYFEIEVSQ